MMYSGRELQIDYQCNFDLIGLTSPAREYKLAWWLNKQLRLNLAKSQDLVINFIAEPTIIISNFTFTTSHCSFKLLKNLSADQQNEAYLLPELKNMDYFLMIKNESDTFDPSVCLQQLSEVSVIDSYHRINIDKLANKENLIF